MTSPTARDLIQRLADSLEEYFDANPYQEDVALAAKARAYLAAHPEPAAGPTDDDILQIAGPTIGYEHINYGDQHLSVDGPELIDFAHAVLARWGHQPPQPVPLSERLPTEADCDAEGKCWVGYAAFTDETGDIAVDYNYNWELCEAVSCDEVWLPAHALPLPEAQP